VVEQKNHVTIVGYEEGGVRVYSLDTHECVHTLPDNAYDKWRATVVGHTFVFTQISIFDTFEMYFSLVTIGLNDTLGRFVRVWDMRTGTCERVITEDMEERGAQCAYFANLSEC
jgi:hypothetical protein